MQDRNNLKEFGESLGVAFQIHDDLLDYYGNQMVVGKPIGNDFKDKKLTLPLIHAFSKAKKSEINKIKSRIKKGVKKQDVREIIQFAEKYNGISYAQKLQNDYANKAKNAIASYPDDEVKTALLHFVDYVIKRSM